MDVTMPETKAPRLLKIAFFDRRTIIESCRTPGGPDNRKLSAEALQFELFSTGGHRHSLIIRNEDLCNSPSRESDTV